MTRLTTPSINVRPLVSTPSVPSPATPSDPFGVGAAIGKLDFSPKAQLEFLQKHGAPRRENYPLTLAGQAAYEKDTEAYRKQVVQLGEAAGIFYT